MAADNGMCMAMSTSTAGCHLPDSDGDGTADMFDSCPTDPTTSSGECRDSRILQCLMENQLMSNVFSGAGLGFSAVAFAFPEVTVFAGLVALYLSGQAMMMSNRPC